MNNPLQMNDWKIEKFLKVVLAVQLAMWGAIGLDAIGLQIPILRQIIGFIYLTFVPGIIILRIVKLHKLDNIETLLYTVGLSIATLMFTGLFMSTIYPFFGISRPISVVPLVITISGVVLILGILSYIRDKDFSNPSFIDIRNLLSVPALFLCLLPFLSIFGTYLVNHHQNNILLMLLILIIAVIVLLIGFDKFIPRNLYPLAVFIIATSLLYHRSLISMYLWGWDIHWEYYFSNLVINSHWNPAIFSNINAMLSIVMLAPIYSNICSMSLTWVFKISYPLLFSLVPLGLYRVFQKQTDDRIAFLSCFFFVSLFTFYGELLTLARQQIAELFLVLLILLMIDKNMSKIKRSFLFIVFGMSLVVSHYAISYIYMFCLIAAWLILVLAEHPAIPKLRETFYSEFGRKRDKLALSGNPNSLKTENGAISLTFVLLFIIFTLTWYMYVSASSVFGTIVCIGDHIASSFFTDFLNPEVVQGAELIMKETMSPLHSVAKYLHYISQFFIVVGFITLMLKRRDMTFEKEYEAFSLVNLVLLFAALVIPYFASSLNTSRLYQITIIVLAPFCVVGGITVFKVFNKVVRASWPDQRVRSSLKVLSVFFVIFLLFNSGFVYEVAKDHPGSISLSQESLKKGDAVASFYHCCVPEQDVFSAGWLSKNVNKQPVIYSDSDAKFHVLTSYGALYRPYIRILSPHTTEVHKDAYIYLRYLNVVEGIMSRPIYNTTKISPLLLKGNKIYSNGGSEIYRGWHNRIF